MTGAVIAMICGGLALVAIGAVAASRTRVAGVLAFAAAGLLGGVAALALNPAGAGAALIGATAVLAVIAFAAGALVGDLPETRAALPRLVIALAGAAALAAVAGWGLAPPWMAPTPPVRAPAFDAPRAGDLFLGLVALVGVAGAVAGLLGVGERGVLGGAPRRGEKTP